jgi:hypothetical protein
MEVTPEMPSPESIESDEGGAGNAFARSNRQRWRRRRKCLRLKQSTAIEVAPEMPSPEDATAATLRLREYSGERKQQ